MQGSSENKMPPPGPMSSADIGPWSGGFEPKGVLAGKLGVGFLVELGVFLAETVDAASSVHKTLLAGEKGMTLGTDVNFHFLAGGSDLGLKAAGATEFGLIRIGVYVFLHFIIPPEEAKTSNLSQRTLFGKS